MDERNQIQENLNQLAAKLTLGFKSIEISVKKSVIFLALFLIPFLGFSQKNPDLGAWYMYFGNLKLAESPWAIHGEFQYRNHNLIGDLEQMLFRTGLQYNLKTGTSFLAGYGSITSQSQGDLTNSIHENRFYQEVILRQKQGKIGLMHRFRYEQRWIDDTEFKTRFRYALFLNIPINGVELGDKGSWYVQGYNELFINGEKMNGKAEYFDRNRLYLGLGYRIVKNFALQLGIMEQTTNTISKTYFQVGTFHQLTTK